MKFSTYTEVVSPVGQRVPGSQSRSGGTETPLRNTSPPTRNLSLSKFGFRVETGNHRYSRIRSMDENKTFYPSHYGRIFFMKFRSLIIRGSIVLRVFYRSCPDRTSFVNYLLTTVIQEKGFIS